MTEPTVRERSRQPRCAECGNRGRLVERHDAYCCDVCDTWLEEQCEDGKRGDGCDFCVGRPDEPSSVPRGRPL